MAARKRQPPKRYSDEERASALTALKANGGNVSKTAKQLGMIESTLRRWANGDRHPEAGQLAERKTEDMAAALEAIAWKILDVIPDKLEKAQLNHLTISLGIAIDKARLLRGEPTAINRNELDTLDDTALDERIRSLEARATPPAHGASPAAGPA